LGWELERSDVLRMKVSPTTATEGSNKKSYRERTLQVGTVLPLHNTNRLLLLTINGEENLGLEMRTYVVRVEWVSCNPENNGI